MKLKYKINLVSLGILVTVALAISTAGVWTINNLSYGLNKRHFSAELQHIMDTIHETHLVLVESGVAGVERYVKRAQQDLVERYAGRKHDGQLMIIKRPDQVVLHPELARGQTFDLEDLDNLFQQAQGMMEISYQGGDRFFFHATFEPWEWLIILSVDKKALYSGRDEFLRNVLLILMASLIIGGFIFIWFTRGIVNPILQLVTASKALSRGQWGEGLPEVKQGGEMGELMLSFNEMSERLTTAYQDLESQARELKEANLNLNREIGDRTQAEQELASLNRELEHLVEIRTQDLASKARELEAANRRLMALDEMKSAFLSSVSHELRTPLTSVLGFAKLITRDFTKIFRPLTKDSLDLTKRAERILSNLWIIEQEGVRLTRLINDVLDLNRIESGRMEWRDQLVSPLSCIHQAVTAVSGLFAQKPDVELKVEAAKGLPMVHVDEDKIKQVLINLLDNAIKFTDKGSVTIQAEANSSGLIIGVIDTGIGIPSKDLRKVFDKFHQVSTEDTLLDKPRGTGLGLAISLQIVRHYGGEIWVVSEPGKGSSFRFTIPAPGGSHLPRAEQ